MSAEITIGPPTVSDSVTIAPPTAATRLVIIEHPQVMAERAAMRFPGTWQIWTELAPDGERLRGVWIAPRDADLGRAGQCTVARFWDRGLHWSGPRRYAWEVAFGDDRPAARGRRSSGIEARLAAEAAAKQAAALMEVTQ